jgi:hypothetical protein
MRLRLLAVIVVVAAVGCVLPDFKRVDSDLGASTRADSGAAGAKAHEDAGVIGDLNSPNGLPGASVACNSCARTNCTQAWDDCGADCGKLKLPMSPAQDPPETVDAFLECLVEQCDDTCDVSWGCTSHYTWPNVTDAYDVTLRAITLVAGTSLQDLQVSACQNSDPGCSEGSGLTGAGVTDVNGRGTVTIPFSFFGFFLLSGNGDSMPTSVFWSQPTYRVDPTFTVRVMPLDVARAMATNVGVTLRDDASHLIFRAENCLPMRYLGNASLNAEADGVSVSFMPVAKDSSKVFYTTFGSSIDTTATETQVGGSGYGGAFNLPASQTLTMIATHAGVEVMRAAVQMQPGTVSMVYLVPDAQF